MYCKGCRYPLDGLGSPVCPECGRAFDLADPSTFGDLGRERAFRRAAMRRVQLACSAAPLLVLFSVYGQWLLARCVLGRWPRMSADDPEGIAVVQIVHAATVPLCVLLPFAFAGSVCLSLALLPHAEREDSLGGFLGRALLAIVAWPLLMGAFVLDPGMVIEWWLD